MAKAREMTESQSAERRAAAKRLRGLFREVAPGRSLADELIAERRAEARAEDRAARRGGDS
jgi:hypothetical protein